VSDGLVSRRRAIGTGALVVATAVMTALSGPHGVQAQDTLAPTKHAPLPSQVSQYWFVPEAPARPAAAPPAAAPLPRAIKQLEGTDYAGALPVLARTEGLAPSVRQYAEYYEAVALGGLGRHEQAAKRLEALVAQKPLGILKEVATIMLGRELLAIGAGERAEDLLERLTEEKVSYPETVLVELGAAEQAIGHRDHALAAYRRVYYEFPLSAAADIAQDGIRSLGEATMAPDRFALELKRAERLYSAQRWTDARAAFAAIAPQAKGDDRELIAVRLAECDYRLDRHTAARTALVPYLTAGSHRTEARFFHLSATRGLGDHARYTALARDLVADEPQSEWAAETLNNLASHYIILDEDATADGVFRELARRFPQHRYSERAAWKIGWRAYMNGRFAETAAVFEQAAATFPRADNRPAWLYWSGRARDRMGEADAASARYRLAVADYQNSYYGRLAAVLLAARKLPPVPPSVTTEPAAAGSAAPAVPTETMIRELAAAGLYGDALREVQHAQRLWGDSPRLQATGAWLRHQQAATLTATERFTALRGGINTMRRAYPQFMAAGGERLPSEVLRIIFPLDYWPLIRKYAAAHDLDPFLMAALVAQESTFTPEIRSAANAYGLMQVIPDTGRRVARQLGIRRFTTAMLTQPETNVRIGMRYFKDMADRFGGAHYALAGYNAGPHRVAQWRKEAPGLAQDEFIDNIPYTETQAYVKRILGTAEDYRRLYGQ
jgi:soluble lytic murein transglycosylase